MSTTPRKRSTLLITAGAAVLIVAVALAVVATRGPDSKPVRTTAATKTPNNEPGLVQPAAAGTPGFTIPDGQQAISVQVPFVPGVAGYIKPGDFVNVYGAFKSLPADASPPNPVAKLVLPKVKVLAITAPAPAPGGAATYLLSVNTADAETIVYLNNFQSIYLTLARDDQSAVTGKGWSIHNAG